MFYSIELTEIFEKSLDKIIDYIYRFSFSLETSTNTYNEILSSIYWLKIFPNRYQRFNKDYLVMTIKWKYRVFYNVDEKDKKVIIFDIFVSKQDYINKF